MIGSNAFLVYNQRFGERKLILLPNPHDLTRAYPLSKFRSDRTDKDGQIISYYGCNECRILNNRKTSGLDIVKVNGDGIFMSTTDIVHICMGKAIDELRGLEIRRSVAADALEHGLRPKAGRIAMNRKLIQKYGNKPEDTKRNIRNGLGSKAAQTKTLQRARSSKFPIVSSFDEIPPSLCKTLATCHDASPDEFLIGKSENMLVFCSEINIRTLFNSTHLVCDGTFGYAPQGSYQIYRVFGSVKGHWYPLVTAILNDKREETYCDMWDSVFNTLSAFNTNPPSWISCHFDHEIASVSAFVKYFPSVRVLMCLFHIRSNINKRIQSEGLSTLYKKDRIVNRLIRRIAGILFVPSTETDKVFDILYGTIPANDAENNHPVGTIAKLRNIMIYFRNQWLSSSLGREFVDHYSNMQGPRTTNVAEGYHSTQKSMYRTKHMALGEFLTTFQQVHSLEEEECKDVWNGMIGPKPKDPVYLALDADINVEKAKIRAFLHSLVAPSTQQYKDFMIDYLSRISYLIGFKGVTL